MNETFECQNGSMSHFQLLNGSLSLLFVEDPAAGKHVLDPAAGKHVLDPAAGKHEVPGKCRESVGVSPLEAAC